MSIVNLKYDYQKEMYAEIKSIIDSGETSLSYVLCMGLGKSYIFLKILEDYFIGKKILYVSPKHAINFSLEDKPEFTELQTLLSIDRCTFTRFNKERPEYLAYDGLFIDEAHHSVSPVQGSNIMKLKERMESEGKLVVGFSATPVFKSNYTKTYVDIRSLFNRSVTGMSISNAIREGILPRIKYAVAVPNIAKLMNDTGWSPRDFRLKYSIDSTKSMLENILAENTDIRHWVAFFSNETNMKDGCAQIQSLFPEYTIYSVYQNMDDRIQEVLRAFDENPGKCILVSINMLLEGIHPKTCEGVLLYRKPNEMVFTQIMGRLMDIEFNDRQPIFVDVMAIGTRLDLRRYLEYTMNAENDYDGTVARGDSNRFKESIRDVIDVDCNSYRYVHLLEDILEASEHKHSMHAVIDGVEYTFKTYTDLANQLNLPYANRGLWKSRFEAGLREGKSIEEIYHHYMQKYANGTRNDVKTAMIHGTEIKYKGSWDLKDIFVNKFGLSISQAGVFDHLKNGKTPEEIYDIVSSRMEKRGSIEIDGELISYESYADLSKKLGRYPGYIAHKIYNGKTFDEAIGMALGKKRFTIEVDGVVYAFSTDRELAKNLKVNVSTIGKWKRRGESYEDIIRRLVSTTHEVIINEEVFRFREYKELANKLGRNKKYIDYEKHHNKKSFQEIVDHALRMDSKRCPKSVTVDGKTYNFSTDAELSRLLGRYNYYVGGMRKKHNLKSYEEIIRYAITH